MVFKRLLVIIALPFFAQSIEHILLIWEHKDFSGKEGYVDFPNHDCIPLVKSWHNRITSLNTLKGCYQIYDGVNCTGNSTFVYPMSKNHNNLDALGFNDVVKSVRSCVLDEMAWDPSLEPLKHEMPFWDYVFDLAYLYKNEFRSRASNSPTISWDFLPNVNKKGSLAEQYQDALDWVISAVESRSFPVMADLTKMRKLAYTIFDRRANKNAARRPVPPLGSEEDAVHFGLEVYWKKIVEKIDDEINRKIIQEEDKKLRRLLLGKQKAVTRWN